MGGGGESGLESACLSTTHGYITDCKLDSVVLQVCAGVGVVSLYGPVLLRLNERSMSDSF